MSHPREILKTLEANAQKRFSQNFLTSPHWAEKLTSAVLEGEYQEVWEVGPGLGALTEKLTQNAKTPVRLFEIDRKLCTYLREKYPTTPLLEGDFLRSDWKSLLPTTGKVAVLSNLPYHISSAILFALKEEKARISHLVFTFQKEFAERLFALPRTPDYGSLTVVTQLHFKIEKLGTLPPGAFYPPPEVSSEALKFYPLPEDPLIERATALAKAAFTQRRKKMVSNLKSIEGDWKKALETLGHSPDARAEELSVQDYLELAKLSFLLSSSS